METVTTATVKGVSAIVARIDTEIVIAMETEIVTATGTGIAIAAAVIVTVVTEMEAGGTEMTAGVTGIVERGGTEEMIALLSLNHQNVERADGTTKETH